MSLKKFGNAAMLWSFCVGFTLLFSIGFISVSNAAEYPNKSIKLFTAYPPGGGSDTTARVISPVLSRVLGQQVVVVHKSGGGGVVGTYAAKAAPPDGYTIFLAQPPMVRHPLLIKGITYDITKDFIPLNLSVASNMVSVVKSDAPWQSLGELIADAKKNPGKLTFASAGHGSSAHFAMEMLKLRAGVDLTHVPMIGTAEAIASVLGGHINTFVAEFGAVTKYLEGKLFRPLAVWSKERDKLFPDVPTTAEEGYPKLLINSWQVFLAPNGTPERIVKILEKALQETMKDEKFIETAYKVGWGTIYNLNSKETAEFLAKCKKDYEEVAKAIGLEPK